MTALMHRRSRPRRLATTARPPLLHQAAADATVGAIILGIMAFGLLLHALVGLLGRGGADESRVDALFWSSLLVVVVPAAVVLAGNRAGAGLRRTLALALGLALALSRVVLYPTRFVYHDEIAHEATLDHILRTGRLFTPTPTLPVSAYYPGLEVATAGVHDLTGMPERASAVVILLLARVVLVAALYGFVLQVLRSERAAGLATVVYLCNPQYLFFNSQYSYQTLALPLALLAVLLTARRVDALRARELPAGAARVVSLAVIVALVAAVVLVHHLTGMLLVGFLVLWALYDLLRHRRRAQEAPTLLLLAGSGAAFVLVWLSVDGNPVTSYLLQIGVTAARQLQAMTSGSSQRNALFSDAEGDSAPVWLAATIVASLLATTVLLLCALWRARALLRWEGSLPGVLVVGAAMWPLIPAGHLTTATSEVFDRSAGFVYVGVAVVLAWWVVAGSPRGPLAVRPASVPVVAGLVALLFVGGVAFGAGPRWNRLPGPFLVSADPRAVDASKLAVAAWQAEQLPDGSRVLADRTGRLLAGSIGEQYPVTYLADGVNPSSLLLAPTLTELDLDTARAARLEYVVVDLRNGQTLPRVGVYWESGEWGLPHTVPVSPQAMSKLATAPGVDRVYDNGWVVVYDVRNFRL
ncbi:hypothetical protein NUM3379_18110 [Kineococcus sp. NUM-3379]